MESQTNKTGQEGAYAGCADERYGIKKYRSICMANIFGKAAAGAFVLVVLLAGCPSVNNDTPDDTKKKCECPNGTEHEADDANPCCEGEEDCTCTFKQPVKDCDCTDKNHLGVGETCDCDADAGQCDCDLKVYGTLSNGIKIYREGAIDDATMATNVQKVIDGLAALEGLNVYTAADVSGKIDEIRIMDGSENYYYKNINGKLVLGVNINRSTNQIRGLFTGICGGTTTPTIARVYTNNAVRLAKVMPFDARAFAKNAAAQLAQSKRGNAGVTVTQFV